jgi:HEXXH motif-containing protein
VSNSFSLEPEVLDQRMRDRLAESFEKIASWTRGVRLSPEVFSMYYNVVNALKMKPEYPPLAEEAMDIIKKVNPTLEKEIRGLINEIVLVKGTPYGAVTSLTSWGRITLSTDRYPTPILMAEGIVHEAMHALLFGLAVDEKLVKNPSTQLFPSSIRTDLRPMDGVFHAAAVCWRLYHFYKDFGDKVKAEEFKRRAEEGTKTVLSYADLTKTGKEVFNALFR